MQVIATRRIGSVESFQGPHRESNLGHSVLWHSASTNCATIRPLSVCVCVRERERENSVMFNDLNSLSDLLSITPTSV